MCSFTYQMFKTLSILWIDDLAPKIYNSTFHILKHLQLGSNHLLFGSPSVHPENNALLLRFSRVLPVRAVLLLCNFAVSLSGHHGPGQPIWIIPCYFSNYEKERICSSFSKLWKLENVMLVLMFSTMRKKLVCSERKWEQDRERSRNEK